MLMRQTWNNYNTFTGYSPSKLLEMYADIDNRNGVIFWSQSPNANNPNEDMLNDWFEMDLITENELNMTVAASLVAKDAFLSAYIRNHSGPASDEELFEMRAAFGPGERDVNVLTGRVTQL